MLTFRKRLKEEKGFTLVELLAVIVILGIIAAIAIPAIGKVIDNSRKDAHISNAKMMIEGARMAVANGEVPSTGGTISLEDLKASGYVEDFKSPKKVEYGKESGVTVSEKNTVYTAKLVGGDMPTVEGTLEELNELKGSSLKDTP